MTNIDKILDIISDPSRYIDELNELKKHSDEIDRKLELIEMSGQIEPMHAKAKKDYESAKQLEEDTKAEMLKLRDETVTKLERLTELTRKGEEQLERNQKAFEERMSSENETLAAAAKAVKRRESAVTKREKELSTLSAEANSLISEYTKKKTVLEGAISAVN